MATWFISDLHLSPSRPDITELFQRFCRDLKAGEQLYILGDLVDAWLGDDDNSAFAKALRQALAELVERGIAVFFMAGNRDFLIGHQFAAATGVTVLTEPHQLQLCGQPTLLLHGDSLCTDDVSYQRFRRIIRHPWVIKLLLSLPLSLRMRIAGKLRAASKTQQPLTQAQLAIMDVNQTTVKSCFAEHRVSLMIHGHTHRPAIHKEAFGTRIVLGDWYQQGSMLRVDDNDYQLLQRPLPKQSN